MWYKMNYCPNCSAYQYDPYAKKCSKCGYDLTIMEQRKEKRRQEIENEESLRVEEASYDQETQCSICGEPTRFVDLELDHPVEGTRMPIQGVKLMGGEITKKPVTLLQFKIKGRICRGGHKVVTEYDCREKPLCPICHDRLVLYGASLLSCPRCSRHYQKEFFSTQEPEEALELEGWVRG
jgi:hypothetical protein